MSYDDTDPFEERTTATIAEAFDVMVEASGIVKRNATYLSRVTAELRRIVRPLIWIVAISFLVSIFTPIRLILWDDRLGKIDTNVSKLDGDVRVMQKSADDARVASNEAKVAADAAKAALDAAIANSQQASQDSNEAITQIKEIYEICVKRKEC